VSGRRQRPGLLALAAMLPLVAALGACASVPVRDAFEEAGALAGERVSAEVEWPGVTAEPEEVARRVDALLAEPLTAEGAVQVALLNSPRLRASFAELGRATALRTQAGRVPNPVVEAVARFREGHGKANLEIGVAQEILALALLPARKGIAAAELERARLGAVAQVVDLAAEVRQTFLRLQAERQLLELDRNALLALEAAYQMAAHLREAGNISELDLLVERDFYEQVKLEVSSRELALAELAERLNALLGLHGPRTAWTVEERLPAIPPEEAPLDGFERRAVERSLDLRLSLLAVEAAARRAGISKVQTVLPELEVGGEAEREVEDGESEWWYGPAVAFSIPIFDQGQARRTAGAMEVRRQWDLYTAEAVELRAAARRSASRVLYARQQAEYVRDVLVPLWVAFPEEIQLHYNGMFLGIFQLLDAKRREIEAGRAYVRSLRDYWLARAAVDQLQAGRMPGGMGMGEGMMEMEGTAMRGEGAEGGAGH
jgi:outer membrane protein, heavy metal efflux system